MGKKLKEFYKNNKAVTIAALIGVVLTVGILVIVPDEVTRFTLIMPVFAGFILFSILITDDDELEDKPKENNTSKKPSKK